MGSVLSCMSVGYWVAQNSSRLVLLFNRHLKLKAWLKAAERLLFMRLRLSIARTNFHLQNAARKPMQKNSF